MKKTKWKINWKTVGRNLFIILTATVLVVLFHKIATNGIGFISTIGYFD